MNEKAPLIKGWDEFVDSLRGLPERVLSRLPERVTADPQIRQEAGRRMMAAFAYSALDALAGDGDYPIFRTGVSQVVNIGQPNADTAYRIAKIHGNGTYRLRGKPGSMRICIIAQRAPFPPEPGGNLQALLPGASLAHHDLNKVKLDAEGNFDILLSPTKPEGYTGEWWELNPRTNKLWLRQVKGDWANEVEPVISIERLDIPPGGRHRQSIEMLEDYMRRFGDAVHYYSTIEIDHVEKLRKNGFLNDRLTYYDTTDVVGLEGQYYFECAYDLADDEALLVEAKIPPVCGYWSVMLTNEIFETIDWYNNHSTLNDTQAQIDKDGVVRFIISGRDPGVPNWLDTTGYNTGQFQGRWYKSEGAELPTARKIPFSEVRQNLPAETPIVSPEERDRIIRERRRLLQHRRLW